MAMPRCQSISSFTALANLKMKYSADFAKFRTGKMQILDSFGHDDTALTSMGSHFNGLDRIAR
jgi:hypothetical protein